MDNYSKSDLVLMLQVNEHTNDSSHIYECDIIALELLMHYCVQHFDVATGAYFIYLIKCFDDHMFSV